MTAPTEVILSFEGLAESREVVGRWGLAPYHEGLERVEKVHWCRSFGVLVLAINGPLARSARMLVNGSERRLFPLGGAVTGRIALETDLVFQRISVICPPALAVTVDVTVEHVYFPKGLAGGVGLSKWQSGTFHRELSKYRTLFDRGNQQAVRNDEQARGVSAGSDSDSERLLFQVLGRINSLLAGVSFSEALSDFASPVPGDFDRDGILAALKSNHHYLTEDTNGSILVSGKSHTTTLNRRLLTKSGKVNMSPVASLLYACVAALRSSAAPATAQYMLASTVDEMQHRFSCKTDASEQEQDATLARDMRSPFGVALQTQLRMLLALIFGFVARDPIDQGLLWLERSIRDFDVFQASVYACCAKSLGFLQTEIATSIGVLEKDDILIVDANTSAGFKRFSESISGWRSSSLQSSDYRPDTFVIFDGAPILIDAKFRLPPSANLVADPDALKEVQAYLDEFGLCSAVVVVPRILSQKHLNTDGLAVIEGRSLTGRAKRLIVLELQDSDDPTTQSRMKKAVELAALTACSN